jgi:hypothetical protein
MTALAAVFGLLAIAILAVNFALNANPIVKVITLIGALAAGVILLVNWLVELYGGWTKLFTDISAGFVAFILAIGKGLDKIDDFFLAVFQGLAAIAKGSINGVITVIEGFINRVIGGVNTLVDMINNVLTAGKVIGIDVKLGKIPPLNIPRLAEGGIVLPRPGGVLANIGEGGQAEAVIPLNRLGDFTGNGNGVNITINTVAGDPVAIERIVLDAISRANRRGVTALQA